MDRSCYDKDRNTSVPVTAHKHYPTMMEGRKELRDITLELRLQPHTMFQQFVHLCCIGNKGRVYIRPGKGLSLKMFPKQCVGGHCGGYTTFLRYEFDDCHWDGDTSSDRQSVVMRRILFLSLLQVFCQ